MDVIEISALIEIPLFKTWELYTTPNHIKQWNNASPDWHTPDATNDLKIGGKFSYTMAAKDGSVSFDYWGIYNTVEFQKQLSYDLGDGRKVNIYFSENDNNTQIEIDFEAETENTLELQEMGWMAILLNFKKYAEGKR